MGDLNKYLLMMMFVVQVSTSVFATTIDSIIAEAANSSREFEFFYDMDSGDVKVEMDMLYSREQWNAIQSAIAAERSGSVKREAIKEGAGGHRWSSRVVPYEIAPKTFSPAEVSQIEAALHDWSRYTCLTFRKASSNDKNRVRFQNGGGCFSRVGMVGGTQEVGLAPGCRVKRIVIHEVGHALGLNHEQTRPDRDSYVTVVRGNIAPSMYFNFQKYTWTIIENYHIPYDYYSIMHYGKTAFSINGGITIKTSDVQYQDVIGSQNGLSFRDIKTMNKMYPCVRAANCTKRDTDCPGEGFVGKDCKCWCPGSPYTVCNGTGQGGGRGGAGSSGTGGGSDCVDRNVHCAAWAESGECAKNPAYMLPYCRKSCRNCSDPGRTGGGTSLNKTDLAQCQDTDTSGNCGVWASQGECSANPSYMLRHCRRSCHACNPTSITSSAACHDLDTSGNCPLWAVQGECSKNPSYMLLNCKLSCHACQPTSAKLSLCQDLDTSGNCATWAERRECTSNPRYMRAFCAKSCDACAGS